MPTPTLKREVAEQAVAAINKALKAGHVPMGLTPPSKQKGAVATAAQNLGVPLKTFQSRLLRIKELYKLEPDWSLYTPPEAEVIEVAPPQKPRVRVRVGETMRPEGPEYRVLGIGDLHDHPHIKDKSRFKWIGRYANDHGIPYIRQIGDWGTFDSCSQHETYGTISGRLKPAFEGDIDSLEESIGAMVTKFDQGYNPDCFITMGNHENRVYQWEDAHPEVEGMFGLKVEQAFSRGRFDYCQYGEWDFLGGVGFTHVPLTIMGKPYGGKTVNPIANDAMFSIVFGHSHKGFVMPRPKIGPQKQITVVNLGCALPYGHIEPYAKLSTTGWTWGVYDLVIQAGDIRSHRFVSMIELEKMYG